MPEEILIDTGVPGIVTGTPKLSDYGTFAVDNMEVLPDASGNSNIVGAQQVAMALYYVDELAADLWASLDAALDKNTDPATVACTVNPDTTREFKVGDFVVFNDEAKDPDSGRRSFECAQIVGPGNEGDVVPSGDFQFQREYPGVPSGQATFGTLRCAHLKGVRFYKLDQKTFTFSREEGFLPDAWPSGARRSEASLGLCGGGARGRGKPLRLRAVHGLSALAPQRTVHAWRPHLQRRRVHVPDSGRARGARHRGDPDEGAGCRVHPLHLRLCAAGTTDGQSAYLIKISRDDGATWEPLEYMGIAQSLPTATRTRSTSW